MNVIDSAAIDAIRSLQRPGKPDMLKKIVFMFESGSRAELEILLDAIRTENCEQIRLSAHSIKSSSAYLGAIALSSTLHQLEAAGREDNIDLCQALEDTVKAQFEEASVALALHQEQAA